MLVGDDVVAAVARGALRGVHRGRAGRAVVAGRAVGGVDRRVRRDRVCGGSALVGVAAMALAASVAPAARVSLDLVGRGQRHSHCDHEDEDDACSNQPWSHRFASEQSIHPKCRGESTIPLWSTWTTCAGIQAFRPLCVSPACRFSRLPLVCRRRFFVLCAKEGPHILQGRRESPSAFVRESARGADKWRRTPPWGSP